MKHTCKDGRTIRSLPRQQAPAAGAYSVKADISFSGKSYVVAVSRRLYSTSKWEWTHSKVFDTWAGALHNYHAINEMGKRWEARQKKA